MIACLPSHRYWFTKKPAWSEFRNHLTFGHWHFVGVCYFEWMARSEPCNTFCYLQWPLNTELLLFGASLPGGRMFPSSPNPTDPLPQQPLHTKAGLSLLFSSSFSNWNHSAPLWRWELVLFRINNDSGLCDISQMNDSFYFWLACGGWWMLCCSSPQLHFVAQGSVQLSTQYI